MLLAKANGASINWHNPKDTSKSALMQAAAGGSRRACEYLLINGAKINAADEYGKTALHYATLRNNTGAAFVLGVGAHSEVVSFCKQNFSSE